MNLEFYTGYMDEVRVWNYARTEEQINDTKDQELPEERFGEVLRLQSRWPSIE